MTREVSKNFGGDIGVSVGEHVEFIKDGPQNIDQAPGTAALAASKEMTECSWGSIRSCD